MVSMQEDLEKNVTSAAIQGAQDISEFISLPVECFTTEVFRNVHEVVRDIVLAGEDVSPISVYEKMEDTSTPMTLRLNIWVNKRLRLARHPVCQSM